MRIRSLVPLAALTVFSGHLAAQNSPQMSPAAAVPGWRTFVGANPLGIPFDIVSVELETSIAPGATIGALGSYNDIEDTRYSTIDGRFKYYPGEVSMRGFAVGLSLGYTKFKTSEHCCDNLGGNIPGGNLNAGTLGVLVDYNWAQGPSQRFVIGTGIGAKRILASAEKRDRLDLERAYLTGRFVIGLLF